MDRRGRRACRRRKQRARRQRTSRSARAPHARSREPARQPAGSTAPSRPASAGTASVKRTAPISHETTLSGFSESPTAYSVLPPPVSITPTRSPLQRAESRQRAAIRCLGLFFAAQTRAAERRAAIGRLGELFAVLGPAQRARRDGKEPHVVAAHARAELRHRIERSLHRFVSEPPAFAQSLADARSDRPRELDARLLRRDVGEQSARRVRPDGNDRVAFAQRVL